MLILHRKDYQWLENNFPNCMEGKRKMKNSHIPISMGARKHMKMGKAKFLKPEKKSHSRILNNPGDIARIAWDTVSSPQLQGTWTKVFLNQPSWTRSILLFALIKHRFITPVNSLIPGQKLQSWAVQIVNRVSHGVSPTGETEREKKKVGQGSAAPEYG